MTKKTFASVWDAIEAVPADAENWKVRSSLMMAITKNIRAQEWTHAEAATRLGVTQSRISDLTRGKIALFSVDALIAMAGRLRLE